MSCWRSIRLQRLCNAWKEVSVNGRCPPISRLIINVMVGNREIGYPW